MRHIKFPLALLFAFLIVAVAAIGQEDPRNDVKATLLSIGSGSARFTYERALGSRNSAEFTLGLVGWGWIS